MPIDTHPSDKWQSLIDQGCVAVSRRDYIEAERLFSQALELVESEQYNSLDRATVLDQLSLVHLLQQSYLKAESFAKAALSVKLTNWQDLGDEDSAFNWLDIATSETNLAGIYLQTNQYEMATKHLAAALQTAESVYGKNAVELSPTLSNLALAYKADGRLEEAFLVYKRLVTIQSTHLQAGNPALEATLRNISTLHLPTTRPLEPLTDSTDPRLYCPLSFSDFIAKHDQDWTNRTA